MTGSVVEVLAGRVREQVVVLDRVQRHGDAAGLRELPRPHAAGEHDDLRRDVAAVGPHARHAAAVVQHGEHAHALADRRAVPPRALADGARQRRGLRAAVVGQPGGADHVVEPRERPELGDLRRRDDLDLDAEVRGHRAGPAELRDPLPAAARGRGRRPACSRPERRSPPRSARTAARCGRSCRARLPVTRRRPTAPAACQVVPAPSAFCSSRRTSVKPAAARW